MVEFINYQYLKVYNLTFATSHSLPIPAKVPGNSHVFGRKIKPIGNLNETQNLKNKKILMQNLIFIHMI